MCYSILALRAWLSITLLLVGLYQSVPKQADKSHTNQDRGKRVSNQRIKSAPPDNSVALSRPSPTKKENGPDSETKDANWYEKLFSPVVSNWPLIVVAIWGIWVARSTLKVIARQTRAIRRQALSMRRQTTHLRNSVIAAQKSADALINSERAWLVAELMPLAVQFSDGHWSRHVGASWAALSTEEVLAGEHLKHKLKVTNMGRTPAQILHFQISYSCLPPGVTDLPEGDLGQLVERREFDHVLAAGEFTEVPDSIIDVREYIRPYRNEIEDLVRTALFYGWVEYQHVFGEAVIQVAFRYVYSPSSKRLSRVPRRLADDNKQPQNPN